jgi:hypothetical protein
VKDFDYLITTTKHRNDSHAQQTVWCEEKFGKRWSAIDNKEGVWCCFWAGRSMPGSYRWHFMNEQDAMLFSLRWL